jgi:hypothetical protein
LEEYEFDEESRVAVVFSLVVNLYYSFEGVKGNEEYKRTLKNDIR